MIKDNQEIHELVEQIKFMMDGLKDKIDSVYPEGTKVKYKDGNQWYYGTIIPDVYFSKEHLSVVTDKNNEFHRVHITDIEKIGE